MAIIDPFETQNVNTAIVDPFESGLDNTITETPQRDTTLDYLGKKFTQGALNVTAGGALIVGGLASYLGAEEFSDKAFEMFEGMPSAASDVELGVGTSDKLQSKGERAAGFVAGAIPYVAGFAAGGPAGVGVSLLPSVADAGSNAQSNLSAKVIAADLAIDAASNIAGMYIPGGVGASLVKNVVSGVGLNMTLGAAGDYAKNKITATENAKLAEKYDPTNLEARVADAVFGAAAGTIEYKSKPRTTDLKIDDILAIVDKEAPPETRQREMTPIDYEPSLVEKGDVPTSEPSPIEPIRYDGGVDFYGEPLPAGTRLTPEPRTNELELMPKGSADGLELTTTADARLAKMEEDLASMGKGLELEPLPKKSESPAKTNEIPYKKVSPEQLKETQEELPFKEGMRGVDYKEYGTPEQGAYLRDRTITDITPVKGEPGQFDIPGINKPLGGTGKKGFGQGGGINLGAFLPEKKPKTLEQKAKLLNVEDWTRQFVEAYPRYADKPDIVKQVYDRLSNPVKYSKNLSEAFSDSGFVAKADFVAGTSSTRIGNIHENILHHTLRYEKDLMQKDHAYISRSGDFLDVINKLPEVSKNLMTDALHNNDFDTLFKMASILKKPELRVGLVEVKKVLQELGEQIPSLSTLRKDYFPRMVRDVEGLKSHLGLNHANALEKQLQEARKEAANRNTDFTIVEESALINKYLESNFRNKSKPGYAKQRTIEDVTPDLAQFYATPTEALHSYIHYAVNEIETAKFFGKDLQRDEKGRIDYDNSVGTRVARLAAEGKVSLNKLPELENILKSRLGPGNRAAPVWQQQIKNVTNMGLLANVLSAAKQTTDIVMATHLNGTMPTLRALALMASGKKIVDMKNFGLTDHISQEFVGGLVSAKVLNKLFDVSQFSRIDAVGKNVILNSAILNAQNLVKSPIGIAKLANKWEGRFGDEFPQLVKDLQSGKLTELTDMLAFSQLSKVQPISKLEMPEGYNKHPNGRLLYMMRSFQIKQLDLVRNDIYNELKKGNVKEGLKNAASLSMIYGLAGASSGYFTDWILNRFDTDEVDADLAHDIPMNILKVMGWNEFVIDKLKEGKPVAAIGTFIAPPTAMFDNLVTDTVKTLQDEDYDKQYRALSYLPLAGKLAWIWGTDEGREYRQNQLDRARDEEDNED